MLFKILVNLFFFLINSFNSSKLAGQVAFISPYFFPIALEAAATPNAAINAKIWGSKTVFNCTITLFIACCLACSKSILDNCKVLTCGIVNGISISIACFNTISEGINGVIPKVDFNSPSKVTGITGVGS